MIPVIHLRGTNEPPDSRPGISTAFLDALDPTRFRPIWVEYPADYGMSVSFTESNVVGRARSLELLGKHPKSLLTGYSAGAFIAGDLAADIAAGRVRGIRPERLAGVALLADPKRPPGATAAGIPAAPGHGIAGIRTIPGIPAWWGTASLDGISALAADNPLRSAADLSAAFTLHPGGWDEWAIDMYTRLIVRRDLQLWRAFRLRPGRWIEAADALSGYLFRGAHTLDYLRQDVCVRLAAAINQEVGP